MTFFLFSTNKNTNERTAIREHDNEGQEQEVNEVPIKNKSSKKTKTSTNQHEVEEYEVFSQGTSMSLEIKIYYLIIVMGKIDRLEKTVSRNIASYGIVLTSLPILSSRPTTPISEPILTTLITESRPTIPIMELRPLTLTTEQEVIVIDEEHNPSKKLSEMKHHESNDKYSSKLGKKIDKLEEILKKQSKQIRVLYELQKLTNNQTKWIQDQLRQQTKNNNDVDLTPKVFMEGYIQVCRKFFPSNLWSSFDDFKSELEKWFNLHHPNYLKEIQHKMKDLRAVRSAILKELGLQISSSKKKNTPVDISEWKRSQNVKECHYKLYDEDENVIENIAKQAFPTLPHDNELLFNDIYVYTASDLLLNNESIELDDSISIIREEIPEMKKKVVVEKDNEEEPRSEKAFEQNFDELFDHSTKYL
ncbi:uncharacterized protein OCT59_018646 [Rhizophagus irregularis]|uniref:uncharacterized protein n=1 Tax=Rhizophagus irregularis TaxID=588596 RepID=UPI00333093E7|nr:hypothetical protein OCT59_018646 [Rhizophagus irregularis]